MSGLSRIRKKSGSRFGQAAEFVIHAGCLEEAEKNKLAMAGLFILLFLFVMAVIGPFLSPHSVVRQSLTEQNLSPSADHWFGTDELGRDVFTRTWYGARISLFVGVMAALIDFLIGVIYGALPAIKAAGLTAL